MVKGQFVDADKPVVSALVAWNDAVYREFFILDTGFTGDLVVTPELAEELGLEISGVTKIQSPGGKIGAFQTASAIALMEGEKLLITVCVADGWPLLGISFMQKFGYKAIVDCKNKTVELRIAKEKNE